jgi:hypothetical protein
MKQRELLQSVADELNAKAWGVDFTAQKSYKPVYRREELQSMRVDVVPAELGYEVRSRRQATKAMAVDVLIHWAIDPTSDIRTNAAMDLVEDIAEHFCPGGPLSITCVQAETVPGAEAGYLVDELRGDASVFVGGIRLSFAE